MAKHSVYLDHAAATPLDKEVFLAMKPYFSDKFGNPSSIHQSGILALRAVKGAREKAAAVLGCRPGEIIFTSGGTEADNLALTGAAEARGREGHIIINAIEHHAILSVAEHLKERGVAVTIIKVDKYGLVNPKDIVAAIRKDTFLVSIMYANNEIGTIEPVAAIGKEARKRGIIMHTDAVQAPGLLPIMVDKLHVDLMSLSAHKFYGPKGVGILYCRRGVALVTQIRGGGQEFGLRSGTENVAGIVGMAQALSRAESGWEREARRLTKLRDWLIAAIQKQIPSAVLTGHATERLANNISFCFPGFEGEFLVMRLSRAGFECSSGSACATGGLEPSHVLLACGFPRDIALGSLRITLGRGTTKDDLERFVRVLKSVIL